jgi:hypothetical protein
MPNLLTLAGLRDVVQECIDGLPQWFVGKPRILSLSHPEQQISFELAVRLRERLRAATNNPTWDRLHFDGASVSPVSRSDLSMRPPPIFVDSRQLFGLASSRERTPAEPDIAIAVHVLRAAPPTLEFDDNGNPLRGAWLPVPMRVQGLLLEERVAQLERLSLQCCDGSVLVLYANESRRRTAVDTREVASWAAWQTPLDTLWWTVRHFRAKAVR